MHLPKFLQQNQRNLRILHAIRVTRDLASNFSLFFLPIFLYQLGSSTDIFGFLPDGISPLQKGMIAIGLYYIINCIISVLASISIGKMTIKIGYQKSFVISYLIYFTQLVMLFYLGTEVSLRLYFFAAILHGFQTPMFWSSYFTILSKYIRKAQAGKGVGVLQILLQLAGVISPSIAGVVASLLGLHYLFILGILVSLVTLTLILSLDEKQSRYQVSWREFFVWWREKQYNRLATSMFGKYAYDAAVYLWPLYVFLLLGSIDKVGYLYTIALFIALVATFFTGVFIDKSISKKPFYLSGGALSLVWFLRLQVFSVWGIVLSEVANKLAANVHGLFFDSAIIKRGKGSRAFSYFIYREIIVNASAVIFWLLLIIFFLLNGGWQGIFIFGALGAMLSLLVRENKRFDPPT